MRRGGTARKRAAAAGGSAIVAGVAAVGLFATPALADPVNLSYTCSGTTATGGVPVEFDLTATAMGAVATAPKVDDPVSLDGFQVTMTATVAGLVPLAVDHLTGSFSAFSVDAVDGDGGDAGSETPTGLEIDTAVDSATGALTFTVPADPQTLSGYTATAAGVMTFSMGELIANLTLTSGTTVVDTVTVTCETDAGQFASVTVAPADTGDGGGGGTGTGGAGNGGNGGNGNSGNGGSDNGNGGNTQSSTNTNTGGHSTTSTTHTRITTSARPTLASTGAPYAVPLTATGGALLLLGVGMAVAGRRRRMAIADGLVDSEPGAED